MQSVVRALGILGVCLLGGCLQNAGEPEEVDESAEDGVERSSVGLHYGIATNLKGALRDAQRATGTLGTPLRDDTGKVMKAADGTPLEAPCGVTFVDRHHAITAAHCVSAHDIPSAKQRLTVKFIDVTPTTDWRTASKLHGTFPHYTHSKIGAGYTVTKISCVLKSRCGPGALACPPAAAGQDIALLSCAVGLPLNRKPVPVAKGDPVTGPVQAFWFHEIYDVPTARPAKTNASATDLFNHYTSYSVETNYHYFAGKHQLLPLMSIPFPKGPLPKRINTDPGMVWTDLYGCHGTSGSGVMQLGPHGYELLGPVAVGNPQYHTRLCADPAQHVPGALGIAYTATRFVRAMAALGDR